MHLAGEEQTKEKKTKTILGTALVAGTLVGFTLPVLAFENANAIGSASAVPAMQQTITAHAKSGKKKWKGKKNGKKKGKKNWNSKRSS